MRHGTLAHPSTASTAGSALMTVSSEVRSRPVQCIMYVITVVY